MGPFVNTTITLRIDSDLLHEAGILATKEGTPISAMVATQLEQIVRARRRALARLQKGFPLGWTNPRSRDELHRR
jgi:hypothetical protein